MYINKCSHTKAFGRVAKLVDALDLGSSAFGVRVRVSSRPNLKKELGFSLVLFFVSGLEKRRELSKASPCQSSSASELRLEQFCDWKKSKKQNAELPLNANEQDSLFSPKFKERTRF